MTARTYIPRLGQPARFSQELTISGEIARPVGLALLSHPSTVVAATLPAPRPGDDLVIVNASASGTAAHTVTCAAGSTLDASGNTVATLNAPGEALHIVAISPARWLIVENIGGVALSGPPPEVLPLADTILGYSPLAYWKLDEASGTTAADSSGNDYDGTYTGAVTLGGSYAPFTAADFGGGYVNLTASGLLAAMNVDQGTVIALARPDNFSPGGGTSTVAAFIGSLGNSVYFRLSASYFEDDGNYFQLRRFAAGGGLGGTDVLAGTAGSWYLVVASWDAGANQVTTSVNAGTADTGNAPAFGDTLAVGRIGSPDTLLGGQVAWDGQLAHVALFNTVLDGAAVAAIYAAFMAEA